MEQEGILTQKIMQETSTPEPAPVQEMVPETPTPEPVREMVPEMTPEAIQATEYAESTIYANDALNQTIYGDGGFAGNIYGTENTDIYGGALDVTIYSTGSAELEPAPEVVQEVPQVDEFEAKRAEIQARLEASREGQEMER
jgi:hypothetical protein